MASKFGGMQPLQCPRAFTMALTGGAMEPGSSHTCFGFARLVGATADDMPVHVLIGVPHPKKVNADDVAASLPHGHAAVQVVAGGLERLNEDGRGGALIANAIITVSLDDGT